MSEAYLGEIRMFGGNYAPANWAFCDGSLLPISENDALYTLLGTTYGGDGQTTFGVPDLRGRLPVGQGQAPGRSTFVLGQVAGTENVTLTSTQMPAHNHSLTVSSLTGTASEPGPTVVPAVPDNPDKTDSLYAVPGTSQVTPLAMSTQSIAPAGGSQPHENRMPALTVSFIISLVGIYPTRG